jgi:hypothetical protein
MRALSMIAMVSIMAPPTVRHFIVRSQQKKVPARCQNGAPKCSGSSRPSVALDLSEG